MPRRQRARAIRTRGFKRISSCVRRRRQRRSRRDGGSQASMHLKRPRPRSSIRGPPDRDEPQGMMQQRLKADIGDWIMRAALAGVGEVEILTGVCERLTAAGIALMRASIANDL